MNEVKFKANVEDLKSLSLVVDEIEETVDAIPVPTVADDGKLLGVTLDETGETPVAQYELVDAPDPLPAIASGDAGKVLTVNAGETGAEWAAASGGSTITAQEVTLSLSSRQDVNDLVHGTATIKNATVSLSHTNSNQSWLGGRSSSANIVRTFAGMSGETAVEKHLLLLPYIPYNPNNTNLTSVNLDVVLLDSSEIDANWTMNTSGSGSSVPSVKVKVFTYA